MRLNATHEQAPRMARARTLAYALLASVLLAACAAPSTRPDQPEAASGFRVGLDTVVARQHMAAAANPHAAEAGRTILRAGGSAVDAAIAIQMVLTLVEPQSSGIGGGAFIVHWDGKRVRTFDGRETAPMGATERLFLAADGKPMGFYDAVVGGRSVGTPGTVRVLELAHREYGRLPWARLFAPAIELAEKGFALSPRLHAQLVAEKYLMKDPAAAAYFFQADGTPKPVGTVLKNPALAATLKAIAAGGADAFYRAPIATDIVAAVRGHSNPGSLTEADFVAYVAKERPPLCTDYKRWRVCGMPPPSSGAIAVAQMLGIFAARNIAVVPPQMIDGSLQPQADAVYLFAEAGRLAFADRGMFVADPDFVAVNAAGLVDAAYLRERAALIGPRSLGVASPGTPPGNAPGSPRAAADPSPHKTATSQVSVIDSSGNAVSMTTTIEDVFGARMMVRGFLLNNELTDFSFVPSVDGVPVANRVQPGKRPRSSMAPTLVFDRESGKLVAALGSPGGSQIIGYVAKTLVGVLDWNLDIQQAISLPNFGSRNGPTELERGRFAAATIEALAARGAPLREIDMTSGLQGIVRVRLPDATEGWAGGADPRREGVALGD